MDNRIKSEKKTRKPHNPTKNGKRAEKRDTTTEIPIKTSKKKNNSGWSKKQEE